MSQRFLWIASVFGALAVILGAFGAHGLEKAVDAKMLQRFHTGVEYQFYHTFALLIVGLLAQHSPQRYLQYAGYAFMTGILLFYKRIPDYFHCKDFMKSLISCSSI